MSFTSNNGHKIHWQEQGEGTPVLLVMGHRYSSRMWYPVIPALAAKHRVITFDNRGTGQSDAPGDFTVEDMARDALAVLDAAGVESAHVYGVSMGGVVSLELGLSAPERVRSLTIGCSGILDSDKPRMPGFLRVLYYLPQGIFRALMRPADGYGSAASAEARAHDAEVLADDPSVTKGVVGQAKAMARYSTTKQAVAELPMPMLVLHGDEDKLVPHKWGVELHETVAHSRMVTIPGGAHNFIVANPELANGALIEFIDQVDAGVLQ